MKRVLLPIDCAGEIFVHLSGAMPEEGCGLLVGKWDGDDLHVVSVAASPNVATEKATAFEIDPGVRLRTQRAARDNGLGVVGHFHSHPNGEPRASECDREQARMEPDLVWLIMGLRWGGPQGLAAWRLLPDTEPERIEIKILEETD
jgi:proteasome lid subunit RPN8/RPN11